MLGEIASTSSLMFCFKFTIVPGFFLHACSWDILRGRSIATRDTRSDEYWSADEISSESRQNRFFFFFRLHRKSPMLYRPALHGNWNALSLARRALKDKFPTPTVTLTTVLQNYQVFLPDTVDNHWPPDRLSVLYSFNRLHGGWGGYLYK
jgi:hypothetical protein